MGPSSLPSTGIHPDTLPTLSLVSLPIAIGTFVTLISPFPHLLDPFVTFAADFIPPRIVCMVHVLEG